MESLYNLFRILIVIYLGFFTYICYQLIFFFQKKLLFIKTITYFFVLAIIIIKTINKYQITNTLQYLIFYFSGIILAKKFLKSIILENNKTIKYCLDRFKKPFITFIKRLIIPPLITRIIKQMKLKKYYKKYPHKKPPSIYELF